MILLKLPSKLST